MIKVSSVEAQNSFGKLLDTAQREPVVVTRHGRPAAFIVSPRDMDELMDARQKRSRIVAEFDAFTRRTEKLLSPEARQLTEKDIVQLVKESRR
ncbi:type II toxin-antitoxin system Phd/YefM family antitoxin [Caenimonas aquaedulcis]|uniref:Antitoxin n=1 Tax=Caenimonas aquaedulcis TaxID=2793270 RepID=A0A931H4A5_9BURK|nr:type II toxin-antitoxin system Phd/YefM family antitoxin [Caenimonas aquaedulcis]MBG9388301.1 type II toxin-antitoxin system Phd/YefM family antitoxin [Caenimonas aquaedulcis]